MDIHQFHQHLSTVEEQSAYRRLTEVDLETLVADDGNNTDGKTTTSNGWWPWNNDGTSSPD